MPINPTTIVYGLGGIKGVGEGAVESIVEARNAGGEFTDLYDFCRRVDTRKVNKRTLEALVKAGCLIVLRQNYDLICLRMKLTTSVARCCRIAKSGTNVPSNSVAMTA